MPFEELVSQFLPLLLEGDVSGLAALFSTTPQIYDPRQGEIIGDVPLKDFTDISHTWYAERRAKYGPLRSSITDGRVVHEGVIQLQEQGGTINLPVALVGEGEDGKLSSVRIYHSMWPLIAQHKARHPVLGPHSLELPPVVHAYQEALAAGDLEAILEQFEDNGYAREPSGGRYVYRGKDELRIFYKALFSNGGGISLEHCSATDDGTCCAIEYNCVRWGRTKIEPQAGVAVYERGSTGLLAAARIYDDIEPPMDSL